MSTVVEDDSQKTHSSSNSVLNESRPNISRPINSIHAYNEYTKNFLNVETTHIQRFFNAQFDQTNRVNCELIVGAAKALIKWHENARHENELLDEMLTDAENRKQALYDQTQRLNVFQKFINSLPNFVFNEPTWYENDETSEDDIMEFDVSEETLTPVLQNSFQLKSNTSPIDTTLAAEMKYYMQQLDTCNQSSNLSPTVSPELFTAQTPPPTVFSLSIFTTSDPSFRENSAILSSSSNNSITENSSYAQSLHSNQTSLTFSSVLTTLSAPSENPEQPINEVVEEEITQANNGSITLTPTTSNRRVLTRRQRNHRPSFPPT